MGASFYSLGFLDDLYEFCPSTVQCYHGGSWNRIKCECKPGTTGQQCEFLVNSFPIEIPQVINATVTVIVKVTHREFTENMTDVLSQAYQDFTELFMERMNEVYGGQDLPEYRRVIIRNLSQGSIVVQNDVVLETNYIPQYKELFKNLTKIVRDKIINETSVIQIDQDLCKDSILCYHCDDTSVAEAARMDFDPQEQCSQKAADGYGQFYYVEELNGQVTCVTRCTPGAKEHLSCNLGECQLQRSGPHCLCPNTDSHWYWGETCELNISKNLVYGLLGAVLALLLVIVLILAIFLSRSQRRLKKFPWVPHLIPLSTDQNLQDKFGLENAYCRFQPSLGTVSPTTELLPDHAAAEQGLQCPELPSLSFSSHPLGSVVLALELMEEVA
ncbi:Mucin-12 [Fukomys damarensis]|uniref:Mucin-12 n=1 Tax=Fukomys damarensis TaxID=885580 RepID=A0A091EMM5_FUKDA|nr:Mucin-12 [Fukomys damarensis]